MRYTINGYQVGQFESIYDLVNYSIDLKTILISINASTLISSNKDLTNLSHQHTGYIDGFGALMVAKKYNLNPGVRISGADLWLELIRKQPASRVYLVGGKQSVILSVVAKLNSEFPSLTICGYRDGFLSGPEDETKLLEEIRRTKPDMIFIAMGQPRQEVLAARLFEAYPALYAGLGGSFDVYAGKLKRAPLWMQKCGLEWLFRLMQEPSRYRRMLPLCKLLPQIISGALR